MEAASRVESSRSAKFLQLFFAITEVRFVGGGGGDATVAAGGFAAGAGAALVGAGAAFVGAGAALVGAGASSAVAWTVTARWWGWSEGRIREMWLRAKEVERRRGRRRNEMAMRCIVAIDGGGEKGLIELN